MMPTARKKEHFKANVVEALAKRAGQRCSYCGLATSGPHDDPAKFINVGEAAHIKAEAPGGPRYDPSQTPAERNGLANAIWLCRTHHKLIDSDVQRFPVEALLRLREEAEARIRREIDGGPSAAVVEKIFSVPYRRNIYFTGRETVLTKLAEQLKTSGKAALGQVAAISGLGGIGKTQTAIEFAYRHREKYRAVFFVVAETEADLNGGFADIATRLKLPEADEPDLQQAVQAAKRWLDSEDCWLLIFDNADTPELLKSFVPATPRGHVIVTSRARNFAVIGAKAERLTAPSPADAELFLLERTGRQNATPSERQAVRDLAKALDNLPLALEQAAAYIAEREASFADYLASYDSRGLELLDLGRVEAGVHQPVAITWSLNIEEVERQSPASADLLRAAAFLAPEAIPDEFFLDGGGKFSTALGIAVAHRDPLAVADLAAPLLRYSLIERDREARTLSVHRLVQEVVKKGLGESALAILQRVTSAMHAAFPSPQLATWPLCERLMPHLFAIEKAVERTSDLTLLLDAGARYLRDRARFAEAERFLRRSLDYLEKTLGSEHPAVAQSLNNLAILCAAQGRLDEVEPLYQRSLDILTDKLDDEHPDVATALNNLASLYLNQGRLDEAEPLFRRVLDSRKKTLGNDHLAVATSFNNLASLYRDQGRLDEAAPLYQCSLAIREKSLGNEHPDVAASLNNLADLYRHRGQLDDAEPLFLRSLDIRTKLLGNEHPDVASSLNNLAILYREQRRFEEAESLYLRSFAILEKALGTGHPHVAASLNNLASLYRGQMRFDEAEALNLRSLAISEKALGIDHPNVAVPLNNLATLRRLQGRDDEATKLAKRAEQVMARHQARNPGSFPSED